MLSSVNTVAANVGEFPFVEALPKREKKRVVSAWERWEEAKIAMASKGTLIPIPMAATLGGVSRPRIDKLCEAGKLERVVVEKHTFVTEESFLAWVKSERKTGRPFSHIPETTAGQIKTGVKMAFKYAYRKDDDAE